MADQHIVYLSSSDSDDIFENSDGNLDDDGGVDSSPIRGSSASRVLPSWAVDGGTSSRTSGYDGQSQRASNQERANSSNWTSSRHSVGNGIADQHQTVNSRISNFSTGGTNYEKLSSQQALKRTLPPSLQSYTPTVKSNYVGDSAGSSHTRDWHGNTSYQAEPSNKRDFHGRGSEDAIVSYENNVNRILPPSLAHGKFIPSVHTTSGNSAYRYIPAEESGAGTDERLVYQAALQDLNQPKGEADLPNGLLSVSLLRHQKIALAWMLHKENRTLHCLGGILADDQGLGKTVSMIALIQMQKANQSKTKLGDESNLKTEALNLDDDDDHDGSGLDKVEQTAKADVTSTSEVNSSASAKRRRANSGGTLIVCPASVLRQWARELEEKVPNEAKLNVLVYHGGTRIKDPANLANYDVVLTTYTIVANEVPKQPLVDEDESEEKTGGQFGLSSEFSVNKKRKGISNGNKKKKKGRKGDGSFDYEFGALARVNWLRVVLDEAQTIKNYRTQVARACCSLRAKKRWCLSGTPIQNTIDDLYSYFRFLRYDPYAVYKSFYETIKVQIARNSLQGYKKLQAVLRAIMLRRSKGTLLDGEPIINLPPKSICLKKVDFSIEERAFYASLEADSRSKFKAYAAAGTVSQNYASILLMLLRLRQACDHPLLVKGFNSDSVRKGSIDAANSLDRDRVMNLLNRFTTSTPICILCSDPPEEPVVTKCGHIFCYQCVSEYMTEGEDNICPARKCKEVIGSDVVFSEATLRSCVSESVGAGPSHSEFNDRLMSLQTQEFSSSKIKAVIEILESNMIANASSELKPSPGSSSTIDISSSAEAPIKTIVFSQWTSMLDLVEMSLNENLIQYRRLDGRMSLAARDRAVREFNSESEVTVMLMSLKAGNLGLNMVAACHVIILDLWWNPTTEDQAIDRAHRIGQTRPVTVTRLTVKDTVEDRILALQEEKRKMVASAFGEDQTGGTATRLTVEDLKYLFNFS